MLNLRAAHIASPIGEMILLADEQGRLRGLDWLDREARVQQLLRQRYGANGFTISPGPAPEAAGRALAAYWDGDLHAIDGLDVATGGTPFQQALWAALRRIPAGATTTYAALARALGRPKSVRAVGQANGANLISIVVPCHRVIGSDGTLTGYGGGLERKRWLLRHEEALPGADQPVTAPIAISAPA